MSTSLAAVFHGAGRALELRRIATPSPRDRGTLVRVLGCTLCGSDLHTYDGRRAAPLPTILGHEIVGEITAFGPNASRCDAAGEELRLGDRVTWAIVASCGECFYCRRDLPQKCLAAVKYGHEAMTPGRELLGGLAEHCLLAPGTAVVRLPDDLPLTVACPASCATATVAAALAAAGKVRDRHVCLFGAGMLGLTASAMLRAAGAASVVCVDPNESRRARTMQFGATHGVTPEELRELSSAMTDDKGFDVAMELSGSPAAFESGFQSLRLGGVLVLVGAVFPTPPAAISPEQIVRRNLTIRGVHNYQPADLQCAVQFLAAHDREFPFAELVSAWFPLESAADALDLARDPAHVRVGVMPAVA